MKPLKIACILPLFCRFSKWKSYAQGRNFLHERQKLLRACSDVTRYIAAVLDTHPLECSDNIYLFTGFDCTIDKLVSIMTVVTICVYLGVTEIKQGDNFISENTN